MQDGNNGGPGECDSVEAEASLGKNQSFEMTGELYQTGALAHWCLFVRCRRFELERSGVGPCSRRADLGEGGHPLLFSCLLFLA